MDAEKQFTFKVIIEGDFNCQRFPSWKTKVERIIEITASCHPNISNAISMLAKIAVTDIIEELNQREHEDHEEATKEEQE